MSARREAEDGYDPRHVQDKAGQFVVLSGCSGGGKSSLLAELGSRGFAIYAEPGRQVVKEQLYIGGDALPWEDLGRFVELTVSRSIHHLVTAASRDGVAFFDRGIVDQISGLEHANVPIPKYLTTAAEQFRYHRKVFMVPPWQDIFGNDNERRHSFEDAVSSYRALLGTYERLGYEVVVLPRLDVRARADFVLDSLASTG